MAIEIISTVLVPAATYDLTDLATVKDELKIDDSTTADDAFLARAITQASAAIAQYCNRVFPVETVQDLAFPDRDAYPFQVPGGVSPLQLSRWPIVTTGATLTTAADTASGALLHVASTDGVAVGQPAAAAGIPDGIWVRSLVANTSVTLSAAVTAPIAAGTAVAFGLAATVTDPPGTPTLLGLNNGYRIDAERGWLVRLNPYTAYPTTWDAVMTSVVYQAGYATMPADLVDAALRVITMRVAGRGRDPMLRGRDQPGVGNETWWVGSVPGVKGAFPEEIADMLDNYRVPVVA